MEFSNKLAFFETKKLLYTNQYYESSEIVEENITGIPPVRSRIWR